MSTSRTASPYLGHIDSHLVVRIGETIPEITCAASVILRTLNFIDKTHVSEVALHNVECGFYLLDGLFDLLIGGVHACNTQNHHLTENRVKAALFMTSHMASKFTEVSSLNILRR